MAVLFDRVAERADDLLTFGIRRAKFLDVFTHRTTGDSHAIAVEQATIEQYLHQRHGAANGDEVRHRESARGLEVGQDGNVFADALKVVDRDVDACGVGDGGNVQRGIGRATKCDEQGDGIFKGFLGEDIARADALFDEVESS